MAEHVEKVTHVTEPANTNTGTTREFSTTRASGSTLAARIVWYIAGVLLALLAFRFVLAAMGANQGNSFVRFIFDVSHPFVAPFFGIFSYDNYVYGVARFEFYTLLAMAVYAVIAWGLARLFTLNRADNRV